jgi:SM-20-related protein
MNSTRPALDDINIDALVGDLAAHGFAVAVDLLDLALCETLRHEAEALLHDPAALDAGIGRDVGHTHAHDIRKTQIKWLDGGTTAQRAFLATADHIRLAINRDLYLGLLTFEAQFALYPTGGFYARHVDSFAGAKNRVVSLVAYLNSNWPLDGGSELDIWRDRTSLEKPDATVTPQAGTVVLMMSEDIPHEVRTANLPRASIAGWWRVRGA